METATAFSTGQLVSTRTISELSAIHTPFAQFVWECTARHQHHDDQTISIGAAYDNTLSEGTTKVDGRADCCQEDMQANNQALKSGERLFSVYLLPKALQFVHRDRKIWIITEADRSVTTILFPSEY